MRRLSRKIFNWFFLKVFMNDLEKTLNEPVPSWLEGKEAVLEEGIVTGRFISHMARELEVEYRDVRNYFVKRERLEEWRKARDNKSKRRGLLKKSKVTIYPGIDELATMANPPSLNEIMERAGWGKTKESLRGYMKRRELHKTWKQNRSKKIKRRLIGGIAQLVLDNAWMEKGHYYKRAIELGLHRYSNGRRMVVRDFEDVVRILRSYEEALGKGKRINLSVLARNAGVAYQTVGRVLERIGDREKVAQGRKLLSEDMKETVRRSMNFDSSCTDIAYFLGVPYFVPSNYRIGFNGIKLSKGKKVQLRNSSQVYEAHDLGFSNREIVELMDISPTAVKVYTKKRGEYAPKIIDMLRVMYPNRKKDVPYLTPDDKVE